VEEVVLKDHSGSIFEGLSSNFGVIKNGKLVTAPLSTVLPGVTMELILQCCEKLGIEVVFECPNIQQVHHWEGAFISSTSRMLMPVNVVRVVSDPPNELVLATSQVLYTIRATLDQEMEKMAVSVLI